jgi:2-polyprenyl-3-methyl-5-hydroxy-6-metoxy-1,4-benzoquinol methylase
MNNKLPLWFEDPNSERALENYLIDRDNAYERWKFRAVRKLLPQAKPQQNTALDYGCGGGQFSIWLAQRGWRVTAADASEHSLGACRINLSRARLADKINLILNSGPNYWAPFDGRQFNLILAKDVIEHVKDDIEFLQHLKRCLKPGGIAIIVTQNDASWNYWTQAPVGLARDLSWCGWDPTHVRLYNLPSLKGKLLHTGLKPIRWRASYLVPYREWMFMGGLRGRCTRLLQRVGAISVFHLPESILGGVYPFSGLGWSIAVACKHDSD